MSHASQIERLDGRCQWQAHWQVEPASARGRGARLWCCCSRINQHPVMLSLPLQWASHLSSLFHCTSCSLPSSTCTTGCMSEAAYASVLLRNAVGQRRVAVRSGTLPDALGPISPSRADSWRTSSEVALRCGGQCPRAEANLDSRRSTLRITLSSCISCSRCRLLTCRDTRLSPGIFYLCGTNSPELHHYSPVSGGSG